MFVELQAAFDRVWRHFLVDGAPPGHLLYRGPNGECCGAGVLLPDDAYRPEFEYTMVPDPERHLGVEDLDAPIDLAMIDRKMDRDPTPELVAAFGLRTWRELALVSAIQRAHDMAARDERGNPTPAHVVFYGRLRGELRTVAGAFGLACPGGAG